jgi:hypothetical protein
MASFSGHETFPLRYAWFAKALEALDSNPHVFQDEEAIAVFGVGRNMVRSILHWCHAAGVIEASEDSQGGYRASKLGDYLFSQSGVDRFFEDPGTQWLIHWMLCRDEERATLWHFVFGHWQSGSLEIQAVEQRVEVWLQTRGLKQPSRTTLKRDLLCLVNSYAPRTARISDVEDIVACPLTSLGLASSEPSGVFLKVGREKTLSPEVFAYVVMDFWEHFAEGEQTLDIRHVLESPGSPGRVLSLSEERAYELIGLISDSDWAPFQYDRSASIQQLYRTGRGRGLDILSLNYANVRAQVREVTS